MGRTPPSLGQLFHLPCQKKCTFLPGCVCPAPANGSVVTWGGGLEAARLTGHGLCLPMQLLSPHRAGPHARTGAFCALTLTLTGGRCSLHRDTKHLMDQTCPILQDEGSSLHPSPTANKNCLSYMFLCRLCSAVTPPGGASALAQGDEESGTKLGRKSPSPCPEPRPLHLLPPLCISAFYFSVHSGFCPRRKGSCK